MKKNDYIKESDIDGVRLEARTNADESVRQLTLAGLRKGMNALDAGCGTGAVARLMAEIVGDEGVVTAIDQSASNLVMGQRLAREGGVKNVRFQQWDLNDLELPEGGFDFVWSRFVFDTLAEPERVVAQLSSLLKPGGILALCDLDGYMLFHDGMEEDLQTEIDTIINYPAVQFDAYAGRRHFRRMYLAGLKDIQVHVEPFYVHAGRVSEKEISTWCTRFETLRPKVVPALYDNDTYDTLMERYIECLDRPDTLSYSTLFLVWGKR